MQIVENVSFTNNVTALIKSFQRPKSQPLNQYKSQYHCVCLNYNSTEQLHLPISSHQGNTVSSQGSHSPRANVTGNTSDRSSSSKSPRSVSGSTNEAGSSCNQSQLHERPHSHTHKILSRGGDNSPCSTASNRRNSNSISVGEKSPLESGLDSFNLARSVFTKTTIFSAKFHSCTRTTTPRGFLSNSHIQNTDCTSMPRNSSAAEPAMIISSSVVEARAMFKAMNSRLLRRSGNGSNDKGGMCRRASAPSLITSRIDESTASVSKTCVPLSPRSVAASAQSSLTTSKSDYIDHSQTYVATALDDNYPFFPPTSQHVDMPVSVPNQQEIGDTRNDADNADCSLIVRAEAKPGVGVIGRVAQLQAALTINVGQTPTHLHSHTHPIAGGLAATAASEKSPKKSLKELPASLHSSTMCRTYGGILIGDNTKKSSGSSDTADIMVHADRAVIPAGRRHKRNIGRAAITQQAVVELAMPLYDAIINLSPAQSEDKGEASSPDIPIKITRPISVIRPSSNLGGRTSPLPHYHIDRDCPFMKQSSTRKHTQECSSANIITPHKGKAIARTTSVSKLPGHTHSEGSISASVPKEQSHTLSQSILSDSHSPGHALSQDQVRLDSELLFLTSLYKDTQWQPRCAATSRQNKDGDESIQWDTSMQDLLTPKEIANPEHTNTLSLFMSRSPGKRLASSMYSSLPSMSSLTSVQGTISQSQSNLRTHQVTSPGFTPGNKIKAKNVARRSSFTSIVQNVYYNTMGSGEISSTSSTASTDIEDRSISAVSSFSAPTSPIKFATNWIFGSQHLLHRVSDDDVDCALSPYVSPLQSSSSHSRSGSVSRFVYPVTKSLPQSLANRPRRRSSDSTTEDLNAPSQDDTSSEGTLSADTVSATEILTIDAKNQEFFRKLREAADLKASYSQSRMSLAEQRQRQEQVELNEAHSRLKDSHYRTLGPAYAPPVNPLAKRRGSQILSDKDRDCWASPPQPGALSGSRARSPSGAFSPSPSRSTVIISTRPSQRDQRNSHRPILNTTEKPLDMGFEGLDPLLFKRPNFKEIKRLTGDEEIAELARLATESAVVVGSNS